MSGKTIQSVERAIKILELFRDDKLELSVKEISDGLSVSKATAHGLIKTLEKNGFLEQNEETKKYKLGLKLFELGNLVARNMDLKQISKDHLLTLSKEVGETIHLCIFDGNEVVYIEKVESPNALRMNSQVGKRAPMYCTGVGKVILAYLDEEKVKEIVDATTFEPFTPHTITNPEDLYHELEEIRKQGYAVDDEEIELGLRCFAAPIFNHQGEVIASISCAGPKYKTTEKELDEKINKVKETALKISKRLGYKEN